MKIRHLVTATSTLIASLFLIAPSMVLAGADSGIYIGYGIGSVSLEDKSPEYKFDESDTGSKFLIGFNFGVIPLIDLAVEGSYVDMGSPSGSDSNGSPVKIEVTGYNVYGLAGLSFGPFGVFAKAGVIDWKTNYTISGSGSSETGSDSAYGVGARFDIASISIRAEYEVYDVGSVSNLAQVSTSLVYRF